MSRFAWLPLLLACGGEPATSTPAPINGPPLIKVRLALNWVPEPEFGGFYEGVLGGGYEASGFQVELIPGGPGAPTLELLGTGRAEAAISSADDLLMKREGGLRVVAGLTTFQHTPQGLMLHAESPVHSFADIGQHPELKVAIELGGPFQAMLWQRFGWEGKVAAVPYGGTVGPFLADPQMIQQAYVTAEPCIARARGAEVRFLPAAEAGWDPYLGVLAFAEPAPAWAGDFLAATRVAWADYLADPSRADAEMARLNPELDKALLPCIFEAQKPYLLGEAGFGSMSAERWEATRAALEEQGLLRSTPTADGAWIPG